MRSKSPVPIVLFREFLISSLLFLSQYGYVQAVRSVWIMVVMALYVICMSFSKGAKREFLRSDVLFVVLVSLAKPEKQSATTLRRCEIVFTTLTDISTVQLESRFLWPISHHAQTRRSKFQWRLRVIG